MTDPDVDYCGMSVAAFESRRAEETVRLIERHGGIAAVSPSLREVPLTDNHQAVDFAKQLLTGGIEVVIFLTGVGFDFLLSVVERNVDRDRYLSSLADISTVVRGPKPLQAMRKVGLAPSFVASEPNTWREVLTTLDENLAVSNVKVGLQEYGKPNPSLVAGLEARGAQIVPIPVYRWGFPLDTQPLEQNVRAIAAGKHDVVLFTSAHQVTNALEMASQLDLREPMQQQLNRMLVSSIGPTTSEALREAHVRVDFEPSRSKLGHLVRETANVCHELIRRKGRITMTLSGPHSDTSDENAPWYDSPFMKACRHEPNDVTPIWLMRQAGRYMPEYREIREKTTFLELCKNPALCAEIMVATVNRLGVDAAIIFSDLLPILEPMGLELEYAKGEGPIIHNPVRESSDIDRVLALESVESLDFVMETVRMTRNDLPADIPVIGFAGAPFTLASYVIEGGASRNYTHTKTLMYRDEGAWSALMERFVDSVSIYLNAQIAAGAQCVQIFDSWAGCLGTDDYRQYVLPHVVRLIGSLRPGVPVISFATGNPALLPLIAEASPTVVGVDWRVRIDEAWKAVGYDFAIQGNLDPQLLFSDPQTIAARATQILDRVGGRPGHIFNLGHGILPQTPVDNVLALIDTVHSYRN